MWIHPPLRRLAATPSLPLHLLRGHARNALPAHALSLSLYLRLAAAGDPSLRPDYFTYAFADMATKWKRFNFLGLEINKKLVARCLNSACHSGIKNRCQGPVRGAAGMETATDVGDQGGVRELGPAGSTSSRRVSESQFDMVANQELVDVKRVVCSNGYSPAITHVVGQKRHQIRFFPTSYDGNVPAGTVVDTVIVELIHMTLIFIFAARMGYL